MMNNEQSTNGTQTTANNKQKKQWTNEEQPKDERTMNKQWMTNDEQTVK